MKILITKTESDVYDTSTNSGWDITMGVRIIEFTLVLDTFALKGRIPYSQSPYSDENATQYIKDLLLKEFNINQL